MLHKFFFIQVINGLYPFTVGGSNLPPTYRQRMWAVIFLFSTLTFFVLAYNYPLLFLLLEAIAS